MSAAQAAPARALFALAEQLRDADTVISPLVVDPVAPPSLGLLAAAGPRGCEQPSGYAVVIEAVLEGYLLHYGEPRVVIGADNSLALLAGDYLYALGLERLATIGDQAAIRQLSDLISLSAQIHADGAAERPQALAWLWIAATIAITAGTSDAFEAAKQGLRAGLDGSVAALQGAAAEIAERSGLVDILGEVAEAIHFPG